MCGGKLRSSSEIVEASADDMLLVVDVELRDGRELDTASDDPDPEGETTLPMEDAELEVVTDMDEERLLD